MRFDDEGWPEGGQSEEFLAPFKLLEECLHLLGKMVANGIPDPESFLALVYRAQQEIGRCWALCDEIRLRTKGRQHFKVNILVHQFEQMDESLDRLRQLEERDFRLSRFGRGVLFNLAGRAIVEYGKDVKEFISFFSNKAERDRRARLAPALASVAEPEVPATLIDVMFGTDRNPDPQSSARILNFLPGRACKVLRFGVAEVSIPKSHQIGKMERPSIWKLQFRERRQDHIMLTACRELAESDWVNLMQARMEETGYPEVFVFVHGFNVGFEDAMRCAAQIGRDMDFPGVIASYSWCSEGQVKGYEADGDNVELSAKHLMAFLDVIRARVGAKSVHIVAHSMGNRALIKAIQTMSCQVQGTPCLDQVVFAAPDVDADIFRDAVAGLGGRARRFTLYGSSNDRALKAARKIRNDYARAGDGGKDMVVMNGVDSVNASTVGEEIFGLGHSYIAERKPVIDDLKKVIREPAAAISARRGMVQKMVGGMPYYELN